MSNEDEDDPPPECEHSRSYHLFFLSPAGDDFAFTSETEDYISLDDYDEETEPSAVTIAGESRVGWTVAVSLVAPFAVIALSEMTTFDNGTGSEPSIETFAETADGVGIADPESHFRKHAGERAFAVLAKLRSKLEGVLEKRGIALLPELEWSKPVPWLRGSEDTFLDSCGGPVRVLDAFFFEEL